ncbi:MAG: insulinase family protein [Candidatus Zixiibacteriota bacterium]|nr:MAG: insulinase family protein [candidate division Zixibacteria bacterium]
MCGTNRFHGHLIIIGVTILIFLIGGCAQKTVPGTSPIERLTLENGMEIIMKANHASPMITCIVFVNAGSKYEDRFNNGATHFLEHLLFNGTATRTQEELQKGIERLGGYLNAFTRREFTAYLVLLPKEFIEYGMATQADMLFNSVFPEESFPKERGIVIEEIKMGVDAEGALAERFFKETALDGTPYARPITGHESIIANIPREAIIDYYKRFYAPNNMMALIIGDFEIPDMTEKVKKIFGPFPAVELPDVPMIAYTPLKGTTVRRATAPARSAYIKLSAEAPHFTDSGYFAFNFLEDYLNDKEHSPLVRALQSGTPQLATDVSTYLTTFGEFSRLDIEIIAEKADRGDTILAVCDSVLKSLSENPPAPELLNGYKVSRRCDDIYWSERLHYYGFIIAPLLAVTGWDFYAAFPECIDSVTVEDMVKSAHDFLDAPAYIAAVVTPQKGRTAASYTPSGPTPEEVLAHYEQITIPDHDLSAGRDFKMPEIDRASLTAAETRHATYLREVFDNGLTVIIKSSPDSRVFALNVLGRNRSATEPPGKDGITDFVNHMIEKGTTTRDAGQLARELAAIGARVTLYDNPWLSHDDRYTSGRFSFMKFETIDEFARQGVELFSDMIANPAFDTTAYDEVKNQMFGLIGRRGGSPYKIARKLFYGTLFGGAAYAKTIEGTYRTLNAITIDDLREHHRRIYSPENMIVSVCTNDDPGRVVNLLRNTLGQIPAAGFAPVEATAPSAPGGVRPAHEKMEKEQVYIYLGHLLPPASSPDAAALKVAGEVLSIRLADNLREKQGLAYTVGASASLDKHFGWLVCAMGTGVDNFERAREGILDEIERAKTVPPTEMELEEAVNGMWGSYLSANLARINQAYYMGVYEYLGLGFNYAESYIEAIRAVTPDRVSEVAEKYFDTRNYVIATAGNM